MTTIQQFDSSVDILSSLLWQQNAAPNITNLIALKNKWYDENQREFWDNWYRDVFDLRTANAFGRRVWSTILGVRLNINIGPSAAGSPAWGFSANRRNFNHGNFTNPGSSSSSLTAEQERLVLQLRYVQLTCRPTVTEINRALKYVFRNYGKVYVLDPLDMSEAIYVFTFNPGAQLEFILKEFDLLPRPSTIGVKYTVLTRKAFGFGPFRKNFHAPSNFND